MKHLKICLSMVCFFIIILLSNISYCVEKKEGINNFPYEYKPYLQELQKKHPTWDFIALYTGLDWKYVIDNENQFGKNLVPKSYSDRWKNTESGKYNVEVDAGWVDSSRRAIEFAMDPRNFLNEVRIFQFEGLSYNEKTNSIGGIEKVLYGTEFYNRIVEYLDSTGNKITMKSKYSDLILSAGKTSGVSSYHLASRIKQEVGPFLSHSSISGTVEGYKGLYNFYNIGATSSSEPMGAIKNGLQYAKDGKGASQATKDKYLIPWNTKQRAITGGGIFIGSSYINLGQDTIYLQKFHVTTNNNNGLFWHQYMTNVLAPYSESKLIYNGYANSGILDNNISFIIPIYNNMPNIQTENPNILDTDFTKDNTKVYAEVNNTLNIRTGPSTSYEVLTTVDKSEIMTRIAKGKQKGDLWDKVQLNNGMIGYVFHEYLRELPERKIEQIKLSIDNPVINKGESRKINVEIIPEEAKNHEIEYISLDENIATVDTNGNVLGISSGVARIRVKSKESSAFSEIKIQVYTPVSDLEINKEKLVLQMEDKFIITPIIFPKDATNKNIIYKSEDENIAKVDDTGTISAISEGNTKIILKPEDSDITKEIEVTVVPKIGDNEIIFDKSLNVQQNEITGWNIKNLTVEKIKEMINTKYTIEIYNNKGELLTDEKFAGTGSKIRIVDDNGIIKMEYEIIIYGDVNGDGKINSVDLLVLQRHILEIDKLKGVQLKAGNINKNGQNPTSLDLLIIQRHILEIQLIEQ